MNTICTELYVFQDHYKFSLDHRLNVTSEPRLELQSSVA